MTRRQPTQDDPDEHGVLTIERQRIDKWIWHARVVKTRANAAALVSAGRVRLNGDRMKDTGHTVKPGDVLTIALDNTIRILKVEAFAERRGDADHARVLYSEPDRPTRP